MPFGTYTPDQLSKPTRGFMPRALPSSRLASTGSTRAQPRPARRRPEFTTTTWSSPSGTSPRPDQTPGMTRSRVAQTASSTSTPSTARWRCATSSRRWPGGRLVVHIVEMPIKCPVAPLEFAFLADAFFAERGMRDKVEITYVTPLEGAFTKPVASAAPRRHARASATSASSPTSSIERVDPDAEDAGLDGRARGPVRPARHGPAQHGRRLRRALRPRRRAQLRAGRQAHAAVDQVRQHLRARRRVEHPDVEGRLGRALLDRAVHRQLPRAHRRPADDQQRSTAMRTASSSPATARACSSTSTTTPSRCPGTTRCRRRPVHAARGEPRQPPGQARASAGPTGTCCCAAGPCRCRPCMSMAGKQRPASA